MKFYKNQKHAPGMHEKHIFECAKHGRVQNSFSGEARKRISQNFARDSYQTMNCESGAVSGVRECASGECSKHILIFEHFR